jgi:hypothetical protein
MSKWITTWPYVVDCYWFECTALFAAKMAEMQGGTRVRLVDDDFPAERVEGTRLTTREVPIRWDASAKSLIES